jgi:ArsR family transcriptional regulator, virulence genes transcriptional regulator
MLQRLAISPSDMAAKAGEAAALMKALSNEHRLLILCHLSAADELSVGELVRQIGVSQSALSQHLALFYRVADARAGQILQVLRDIFCPELGAAERSGTTLMAGGPAPHDDSQTGG